MGRGGGKRGTLPEGGRGIEGFADMGGEGEGSRKGGKTLRKEASE